ncbi:MAG: AI-2E family transporter [Clostridia bacterium]|jgi:predicted PurR-regulated permease PerM|nr:AI-2E family transporter [Clostridia bacterium]
MIKFFNDEKYLNISKYALLVIVASITFFKMFDQLGNFFAILKIILDYTLIILSPFIYGVFIAYLLVPLVNFFDRKLYGKIFDKNRYIRRIFSTITVYSIVAILVAGLFINLVPQLQKLLTEQKILSDGGFSKLGDLIVETKIFTEGQVKNLTEGFSSFFSSIFSSDKDAIVSLTKAISNAATGFFRLLMGLVISFYLIVGKEKFLKNTIKGLFIFLDKHTAKKIIYTCLDFHKAFTDFYVGKTLDSSIIGIICYIVLASFNVEASFVIALIVAITNMIPYFGPFIGAIPAIIITLATSTPTQAMWVGFFIFVLQQFDGIVLGPKILGESTGLNPLWVIFAILTGGTLFGVLGMFLGVPIFVIIKVFVNKFISNHLLNKYVPNNDELENKESE